MKNYLEHEEEVKYVDGLLAKSQDWQWFVNCIEESFELEDIKTYTDFVNRNNPLRRVYANFIKILEVCNSSWTMKTEVCSDLFLLAKYYLGVIQNGECRDLLKSKFGRVLFIAVWLTKLENQDNETQYIIDMRFLNQKNFWLSMSMESIALEEDDVLSYIKTIDVEGFEGLKKCVADNVSKISYPCSLEFIEKYKDNLLSANAFNYQHIQKNDFLLWQEETLLEMLSVSLAKDKLLPLWSSANSIVPDFNFWNSQLLMQIKEFFSNPIADFVLETIDYIKNGVQPSVELVLQHCSLLSALFGVEEDYKILSSSTYTVLSRMFEDKISKIASGKKEMVDMIKKIHEVENLNLMMRLKSDGFPVSKEQRQRIKTYIDEQYKKIEKVNLSYELLDYLRNTDIPKSITQEYYNMVIKKFYEIIQIKEERLVPSLFYQYMLFLLEVNHSNQNVDRRRIKMDMITVQEYWHKKAYKEQYANLQEYTFSTTIPNKDIEMFNEVVLANPILMAQKCMLAETDAMCDAMNTMSEHAINYMFTKMLLSPIYPMEATLINYDNHDLDKLLRDQVEDIKKKYGYKFLNVLDTDTFVNGIHERYTQNALATIPMFKQEEKLYGFIEQQLGYRLFPFDKDITLGHLTQLFPLLEMQIRELGKMIGVVPFKEKVSEFMKFKDPRSVLREILLNVYTELNGFENVPDLLFVYHFMYNGNSLNVRNECIHGRDYTEGGRLRYAFKITLLSLYMIIYRINVIKNNME